MIKQLRKHLPILMLVGLVAFTGCKSKKKAMEAAAAAERTRIEQEHAEKKKAEEQARQQAEQEARERTQREEEARLQREASKTSTPAAQLAQYFTSISTASNSTAANNSIHDALSLFASPETPVLIVISDEGGVKDYDKPTTIRAYLNYLKDQKKSINAISELKTDGSGKITELELKKN